MIMSDDVNVLKKKMASYSFLNFFETKSESSINFPGELFAARLCSLKNSLRVARFHSQGLVENNRVCVINPLPRL